MLHANHQPSSGGAVARLLLRIERARGGIKKRRRLLREAWAVRSTTPCMGGLPRARANACESRFGGRSISQHYYNATTMGDPSALQV